MKLIREIFELWVRWNWLRHLEKEGKKLKKYTALYIHQRYVYNALSNEYSKRYGGLNGRKDSE